MSDSEPGPAERTLQEAITVERDPTLSAPSPSPDAGAAAAAASRLREPPGRPLLGPGMSRPLRQAATVIAADPRPFSARDRDHRPSSESACPPSPAAACLKNRHRRRLSRRARAPSLETPNFTLKNPNLKAVASGSPPILPAAVPAAGPPLPCYYSDARAGMIQLGKNRWHAAAPCCDSDSAAAHWRGPCGSEGGMPV
jgi:hypothetical protein